MSYSFTVKVQDGNATVKLPEGHLVPDGNFTINGHHERSDEHHNTSVGIQYVSVDGSESAYGYGQSAHCHVD